MKQVNHNDFYFGKVKWNEMFEDELELVNALKLIEIDKFKKHCNGYEFIEGFQNSLLRKGELSKPQMTQLKRLAKQVYKYHNNL